MSSLEDALAFQLDAVGIAYQRQVRLIEGRKWTWDFWIGPCSWGVGSIAIEVQGGVWVRSGHTTGRGVTRDCEKANAATLAGYRLLFFTRGMIESGEALRIIERAIGRG